MNRRAFVTGLAATLTARSRASAPFSNHNSLWTNVDHALRRIEMTGSMAHLRAHHNGQAARDITRYLDGKEGASMASGLALQPDRTLVRVVHCATCG